jgi:hypothetical protein
MVHGPLELLHALHLGNVPLGRKANGGDEPPALGGLALSNIHRPASFLVIPPGARHVGIVRRAIREMQFRVDIVEIATQLMSTRILFLEIKATPHFLVEHLVQRGIRIDSRAWVGILMCQRTVASSTAP